MVHGHASKTKYGCQSKTYIAWVNMKGRCLNPQSTYYPYYGGRGITVCDEWLQFTNFLNDMGESPAGLTLDRIDNDGHYEPGNCRWVSMKIQSNNRRARGTAFINNYFGEIQGFIENYRFYVLRDK